jgi:hypothetical protein
MTITEILLIVVSIIILIGIHLLIKRVKRPYQNYIRIGSAVVLLLLAWVFKGDGGIGPKLILSAVAISSLYKEYLALRTPHPNN